MNNSEWIENVRNQISDNKDLLNTFNEYADIIKKYAKFEPEIYRDDRLGRPNIVLKWKAKQSWLSFMVHEPFGYFISSVFGAIYGYSVKDSDFPEQDIKIVHGDEQ